MRVSHRASSFTESVIREMTRLAMEHDAINLAQGFPDFPAPQAIKDAACRAVQADVNQYAVTWGAPGLRRALADKYLRFYGMDVDPDSNICVMCGATEAMIAAMLGVVDPGDEVVVFEPYYENYGPDAILAGARPRYVSLRPPDWSFDEAELAAAFSERTRGIIINTPNNPTGKVFARDELELIAELCQRYGAVAFTDEIYEHIVYDEARHVPLATLSGMEDRTVTIGWTIASHELTDGIRKVHDFLTVGAPAPLQEAGIVAVSLGDDYYEALAREYDERRDIIMEALARAELPAESPKGAYYVLADVSRLGFDDDVEAAHTLVRKLGIATVPGSSFFSNPEQGRRLIRFSFSKRLDTLREAARRLAQL